MSEAHRLPTPIAVVVLVVLLAVLGDVMRRSIAHLRAGRAEEPELIISSSDSIASAPSAPVFEAEAGAAQALDTSTAASTSRGTAVPAQNPSHMELVARAETRRQIRASAPLTYLSEIVATSADSMLHRWDNRVTRPVRVHLAGSRAANFHPAFQEAVRSALREWEEAIPIRFDPTADSAAAEVRVVWKVQFDIDRTGQTDLTWDGNGHVQGGVVTLATFDPEGRPMGPEEIRVVALHEFGHVVGLDHSSDAGDVMFPVATPRRLSQRDVETARLLYRLAPGSLR